MFPSFGFWGTRQLPGLPVLVWQLPEMLTEHSRTLHIQNPANAKKLAEIAYLAHNCVVLLKYWQYEFAVISQFRVCFKSSLFVDCGDLRLSDSIAF
jgi:hypothetical protein